MGPDDGRGFALSRHSGQRRARQVSLVPHAHPLGQGQRLPVMALRCLRSAIELCQPRA